MELTKWNVWHTYSYYFIDLVDDLHDVADKLVQSQLVVSAFHSEGIAWYYSGEQVVKSTVEIDRVGYESTANVKLPKVEDPYALECILQSARMRVAEMGILNERVQETLPYVRAHLAECTIQLKDKLILLYPQIKIYDNGAFLVEFRTISPSGKYSIDALIDDNINLFTHIGENVELPPGILKLYARYILYENSKSPQIWFKAVKAVKENDRKINKEKYTHENNFEFEYISLGYGVSIKDIFDYICGALIVALDVSYQSPFPMKKKQYNFGSHWTGRPSIYLTKYADQPFNASEILTKFKIELNKIMGRTTSEGISANFLGQDLRVFDDFSLYVNKALTLFVFSRRLKHYTRIHKLSKSYHQAFKDPNLDEVYCLHQIKVEIIDFAYTSYWRMLERSTLSITSVTEILREKEQLIALENILEECSIHGELNDFFKHSWKILSFDKMRANIEQNFVLKIARLSELRGLNIQRFGWILSILFGLSGAVNLAQNFVQPLWRQSGMTPRIGEDLFKIYSTAIAAGIMLILIIVVWFITVGRKPKA